MNSKLALITFLDGGGGYPDNTLPQPGAPVDPGYGQGQPLPPHPWRPGHLGGPRPDQGLPGFGHPDQGLPGGGNYPSTGPVPPPVTPDNSLPSTPSTPPPQISLPIYLPAHGPISPDAAWELKYSARFGWVLVPIEDEVAQPKK